MKDIMFHYVGNINRYHDYESSGVFQYVSKKEKEQEKAQYDISVKFVKEVVSSEGTSKNVLKDMLKRITFDNELFSKFVHKNKLEISIFNEVTYFNSLEFKPTDLFHKDMVEIIEIIEKKLGINYFDRSGKSPKEVFAEISQKGNHNFNSTLILNFSDGTKEEVGLPRKFK
jgi:hypothetical protein